MNKQILQLLKAKDIDSLCQYEKRTLIDAMLEVYQAYRMEEAKPDFIDLQLADIRREMLHNDWKKKLEESQSEYESLREEHIQLHDDYDELNERMETLQAENEELKRSLTEKIRHQGGSRRKYSPEQRKLIYEHYMLDGETYPSTAAYFHISTNTLGRILKEFREAEIE